MSETESRQNDIAPTVYSIDLSGESFSSGCIWDYDPVVDVVVIVDGERLVSK
jgi:hypothetical protein